MREVGMDGGSFGRQGGDMEESDPVAGSMAEPGTLAEWIVRILPGLVR